MNGNHCASFRLSSYLHKSHWVVGQFEFHLMHFPDDLSTLLVVRCQQSRVPCAKRTQGVEAALGCGRNSNQSGEDRHGGSARRSHGRERVYPEGRAQGRHNSCETLNACATQGDIVAGVSGSVEREENVER